MNILKFNDSVVVVNHIKMVEKVARGASYGFLIHFDTNMYSASWFLTKEERDKEYDKVINAIIKFQGDKL